MREVLSAEPALAGALVDPPADPLLAPLITPPLTPWQAAGLDLILEGFLLHHGRPRYLRLSDRGRAVLAGDYCYAHGLVRIADAGDLFLIEALSDLIALGAGLVATGERAALAPLWRGTAAAISARGGDGGEDVVALFTDARERIRQGDLPPAVAALDTIARDLAPTPELTEALA